MFNIIFNSLSLLSIVFALNSIAMDGPIDPGSKYQPIVIDANEKLAEDEEPMEVETPGLVFKPCSIYKVKCRSQVYGDCKIYRHDAEGANLSLERRHPIRDKNIKKHVVFAQGYIDAFYILHYDNALVISASLIVPFIGNGKSIIPQNSDWTSSTAVINMLLLDRYKKVDNLLLAQKIAIADEKMPFELAKRGFKLSKNEGATVNLEKLHDHIGLFGLAVKGMQSTHWIIVDNIQEITDEKSIFTIRDPYHQWGIDITLDAIEDENHYRKSVIWVQK